MTRRSSVVLVECTRQGSRSPTVVSDRCAVLHRELDPDLLVATKLRGRMRSCPHEEIADLDDAVEAIAEECRDAQRSPELVRPAGRLGTDHDVLRSQHQQTLLAWPEPVGDSAGDDSAEDPDESGACLPWAKIGSHYVHV